MAVEKAAVNTGTSPKRSRLEMNVRQLLTKCELIAKSEPVDGNWRLKKYVESLGQMITELMTSAESEEKQDGIARQTPPSTPEKLVCSSTNYELSLAQINPTGQNQLYKPNKESLAEYTKRASFLKGLIKTATLHSPIERLEAVQQLSHGAATMCADASAQEIHQKTVAKYGVELRSELFGLDDSDESLRKRNIIKAPNFTSNSSSQEDIDSLLKYHQNMQEKVAENMVMLTKSLKEQSQIASTIIRNDTEALKKSSELTDRNVSSLKVESDRLQVHSRSAWKCWLWLMLAVVMAIFINMVLFMKVMKKRKYDAY